MLIDQLVLRAFRGCREHIELDLSAPLTLIYAPNGTGKTTVCDGVEWLISGEVHRLGKRAEVTNWFSKPQPDSALVELRGVVGGTLRRLSRTSSGQLFDHSNAAVRRAIPNVDFHRELVGREMSGPTPQTRHRAAQTWLRATRFLDGELIAHLVDDGVDKDESVRETLFSDLFGMGDAHQPLDQLKRILKELRSDWDDAGSTSLERAVSDALIQLDQTSEAEMGALSSELLDRLGRAEKVLGIVASGDELTLGRVEVAELRLLDRTTRADRMQSIVDWLRERWEQRKTWDERATQIGESRAQAETQRKGLVDQADDARRHLSEVRTRLAVLSEHLSNLTVRRNQTLSLLPELGAAVGRWTLLGRASLDEAGTLEGERSLAASRIEGVRSRLAALVSLDEKLKLFVEGLRRRSEILDRLGNRADSPTPTVADLHEEQSQIDSALRDVLKRLEGFAGPVEKLRLDAVSIVGQFAVDDGNCPVCGIDHETRDRLDRAIKESAKNQSFTLHTLARQAEVLRLRTQTISSQRVELEVTTNLREELAAIEDSWPVIADALDFVGLSHFSIQDPNLINEVSRSRHETARQFVDLQNDLFIQDNGLESSRLLRDIHERVHDSLTSFEPGFSLSAAPTTWLASLNAVLARIADKIGALMADRDSLYKQVAKIDIKLSQAVVGLNLCERELATVDSQMSVVRKSIDEFDTNWRSITGDQLRSDKELSKAIDHVAAEKLIIQSVAPTLSGIGTRIEAFRRRVSAASDLNKLQEQLFAAQLRSRSRRLWQNETQKGVDVLQKAIATGITEQVEPLRQLIAAVFGRSQAHHVISEVSVVPTESGRLDWRINVSGHEVERTIELSRGQRLDLAASMFLARAISLGGTVMLDEPLLHLDDLNRVGMLDTLRVLAQQHGSRLRVVLTTADRVLVRHLREKFGLLALPNRRPLLRVLTLRGSPNERLVVESEEVMRRVSHDEIQLLPKQTLRLAT